MINPFSTEKEMVNSFLHNPQLDKNLGYTEWKKWKAIEVSGLFGIPDVVIAFGKVSATGNRIVRTYAFELKLRNWKRALTQAYRYSAFAHYSSVVLDYAHVQPALENLYLFKRSNIGLLTIDTNNNIVWYNRPKYQQPYSAQLHKQLSLSIEPKLFVI